jgi:protein TonB
LNATAQYFENYIAEQREEILRWTICLAVVVLIHGAAGFALRQYAEAFGTSDDQDLSVVMLELPEPPQPPVEEKKEEPPPPPEEEKPPEPEPEVAMPTPEPPPPVEEKPVTAPPPPQVPVRVVATWQGRLAAHIERFKRYPADARAHGEEGLAKVAFTIDHAGRLLASRIVQSSGSPSLDQETLEMLARAQPMPPPPDGTPDIALSFVVPVRFFIR